MMSRHSGEWENRAESIDLTRYHSDFILLFVVHKQVTQSYKYVHTCV